MRLVIFSFLLIRIIDDQNEVKFIILHVGIRPHWPEVSQVLYVFPRSLYHHIWHHLSPNSFPPHSVLFLHQRSLYSSTWGPAYRCLVHPLSHLDDQYSLLLKWFPSNIRVSMGLQWMHASGQYWVADSWRWADQSSPSFCQSWPAFMVLLFWCRYIDIGVFLVKGKFPVGVAKYIIWPETSKLRLLTTFHHLWFLPVCLWEIYPSVE